jgi:hypothetical protein
MTLFLLVTGPFRKAWDGFGDDGGVATKAARKPAVRGEAVEGAARVSRSVRP